MPPKSALIFANGDAHDGPMVRRTLQQAQNPLIVAANGGARIARQYELHTDVIVGDMDSLPGGALDMFARQGIQLRRHPPEKDFTDLELALHYVHQQNARWIRIFGAIGGRLDQTLANVHLLALTILQDRDVRLVAGAQETLLLRPGDHTLLGAADDTVSLIPLNGDVGGITTEYLRYPLRDETLLFGSSRGISNVMKGASARVTTRTGLLLLVHTIGRA